MLPYEPCGYTYDKSDQKWRKHFRLFPLTLIMSGYRERYENETEYGDQKDNAEYIDLPEQSRDEFEWTQVFERGFDYI